MSNKIIIITNLDLENLVSTAAGNRILSYAECLVEYNATVFITSVKYSAKYLLKEISPNIYLIIGDKQTHKYYINDFRFTVYYRHYKYLSRTLFGRRENTVCLLYDSSFASITVALIYIKFKHKIRLYIEKNELQLAIPLNTYKSGGFFRRSIISIISIIAATFGAITDSLAILADGIIAISSQMYNLYKKYNPKTILIPILSSSVNQLIHTSKENERIFKIGFAGVISQEKEGVSNLIMSITKLKDYEIELHLMGLVRHEYWTWINDYVQTMKIENKVFYHGNLTHECMVSKLQACDLLVLVRPNSLQTRFGFSTKLSDYLSTGVPVLISETGDAKNYITDKVNGFVITDISPNGIAVKIKEILSFSNDSLSKIGHLGSQTCVDYFYCKNYSKKLYSFLFD